MRILALAFLLAALLSAPALAQTYPVKTVRLIAPFAPGGATDVLARGDISAVLEAPDGRLTIGVFP